MWITFDEVVTIRFDIFALQTLFKLCGCRLTIVMGYDNRAYHEPTILKLATKTENILIISDTQVGTLFILFDVSSANYDNDFDAIV